MVVQEATQVIITNWKGFIAGVALGWLLGFVTFFSLYVLYKVFPQMDAYVSLVRNYKQFLFKEKRKHLSEYDYFEERRQMRTLSWLGLTIIACLIVLLMMR